MNEARLSFGLAWLMGVWGVYHVLTDGANPALASHLAWTCGAGLMLAGLGMAFSWLHAQTRS